MATFDQAFLHIKNGSVVKLRGSIVYGGDNAGDGGTFYLCAQKVLGKMILFQAKHWGEQEIKDWKQVTQTCEAMTQTYLFSDLWELL